MRKFRHLLLIILAITAFRGVSQNYYMNSVNGQTITTCRGNVMPSWLCGYLGYAAYCNSENYTVTFYSGSPTIPMRISFLSLGVAGFPTNNTFYTEAGFDFLTIIDGPSVGSPTLASLSGAIANTFSYTSTGGYLTLNFKSDASVNDWGWFAIIGCKPQGCSGNLPAGDFCSSATAICDLNGYCGSTNGWYTPDNANLGVNLGGPFCGASGSIENNAWIKFIPTAASATVNVNVANCTSATQGLQAGLFATNCSTFSLLTCQSQATYAPVMSLSYSSFVPGQVYYLMIDGYAGNACDYTVSASSGVAVSSIAATSSVICNGQSTSLTAVAAGSSPSYTWSTGSNSSTISVSPTVTTVYTASISSGFCNEVITKTITVNPLPSANAGVSPSSITCANPTRTLSGSGGGSYTWSGPGIVSGGTSANPVVNQAGTYSLVVTSPAGCNSNNTATVAVSINTTAPTASVSVPAVLNCTNTSMALSGLPASGVTYVWSGPSSFTSTSQNPSVTLPGTYNLTVTSTVNGCTNTANASVSQNTTQPASSAGTSGSVTCSNNTITLSGNPASMNYTWTAPGGSSISSGTNSQNAVGSGSGTYTLNVQDPSNGCSKTATVAAVINTVQPAASAGTTGSVTCSTSTINLSSSPASMNYTWTAPGGSSISSGTNSQNAVGSGSGTYTVTVKDPVNGCSKTATIAAVINTVQPAATAGTTGSVTCSTNTINLSSSPSSMNYTWTAPGGSSITSGTNSQNAVGQGSGTYTVNVVDPINGCSKTATVAAVINTVAPSPVTASSTGTVTCASSAINLSSTPASMTYSWTAPSGASILSGSTSQNASGNGAGTYSVLITNPINGCSSQATVAASTNTLPPVPAISPTPTITCTNTLVTLIGNPTSGVTYNWIGGGVVGSTNQQTVTINQSSTYTLIITSTANSCTAATTASVPNNTLAPTITPVATQTITCASPSVTLVGSAIPSSCTVVWSGGVCAGANSYTATACAPGTYTYIATNPANGCPSAAQVATVVPNSSIPSATVVNTGTITCSTTTVQVVATSTASPISYSWTGTGIVSGSSTATITVNAGGTYSLVLLNTSNSCSVVITNSVTADNAAFTPTATSSSTITCNTTTVNLTANAGSGTYTYNWSGPAIVGTNTLSTATASLGGLYTVTVTNSSNGCVGTETVSVVSNTTTPTGIAINPSTFTLSCATPTTILTATATGASTYTWIPPSGGSIISGTNTANAGISGAGIYSVVVAGTNGCPSAAVEATVVPNTNAPTFTLSNSSPSITCLGTSPTVSVAITSTVPILSYSWSPATGISSGANSGVVTFTAAGTYTGVITANNGCISNAIVSVNSATTLPNVVAGTATAQAISCANPTVVIAPTFTPSSGLTYTWTGPGIVGNANDSIVSVNQNGTYSLVITNTLTGCASTAIAIPVVGTTIPPTLNITSTSSVGLGCLPSNSVVVLTANSTPSTGVNYSWSNSATSNSISVTTAGVYSVVVTDVATSCSVVAQYTVDNNVVAPTLTVTSTASLACGGGSVSLNSVSTNTDVVFAWSGPGILTGSNTATPSVNTAGIYTVLVTNTITGCTATNTVNVMSVSPVASFTPDVTGGVNPLTVNLGNTSVGASTYNWVFDGNFTSPATTFNASTTFTTWGTHTITLVAYAGACSDTTSLVIMVDEGFSIEIPNVFTPNNDGTNDVFTIKSKGVKEISLEIYNRWGQKMYEFTGAKAAWDGITGNGEEASAGTYFYFVKAKGFDDKVYEKQGPVSLFR